MATLETPASLRKLQRALYLRAKKEPHFRAYALYDKVYRPDILAHAYALAKANGGAPGPDGHTFAELEADGRERVLEELREELKTKTYRPGPVRRVYIPKLNGGERPLGIPNIRDRVVQTAVKLVLEPLFEADFEPDSYGFRPRRAAHDALDAIRAALHDGMYWVIDADVTAYFDTIPHDRLMKTVAERVVDGAMLALVKRFLEAPIIDERDGGRPRRPRQGTPQGGVVSPLLANVYLHLLDRNFRLHVQRGELHGRLVRYADDFVLLTRSRPTRELAWVQRVIARLGLALHAEKTRVLDARRENFVFLGHLHRWRRARLYLDVGPEGASTHSGRAAAEDTHDGAEPAGAGRRTQPVHPGCPALLPSGPPTDAGQTRSLCRTAHRALVGAEARAPPACMVARATGSALAPTWARAVEPPGGAPPSGLKARPVNVEGSRMREIRTYGLMRGCWSVRLARRAGVYSTRLRRLRNRCSSR